MITSHSEARSNERRRQMLRQPKSVPESRHWIDVVLFKAARGQALSINNLVVKFGSMHVATDWGHFLLH